MQMCESRQTTELICNEHSKICLTETEVALSSRERIYGARKTNSGEK